MSSSRSSADETFFSAVPTTMFGALVATVSEFPVEPVATTFSRASYDLCSVGSSNQISTSLKHSVLHQHECDLRDFWLRRLAVLRSRASVYVEMQDLPVLPGEDVLILSLGTGAWGTLKGHIRRFEVFEKFLSPEPAWPLEMGKVLRYSAALSHKPGCSTLIDSFVGTCSGTAGGRDAGGH